MTRIASLALALAVGTGCIYVDRDHHEPDVVVVEPVNHLPFISDAYAACGYDAYNADDVVWFEAVVDDADGVYDVVQVWADLYDDVSGQLIESFELYPTDDPYVWFSDWLVSTTYVDCWYPYQSVDLVAYDSFGDFDIVTVPLDTYR